jgi:TetR/AcrR family transcriptional repressor of nem operon
MKYNDTRMKLIEVGSELMSRKGYNGVGLKEILDYCKIPKGSFYHYFKSKEDFCIEIINMNMDIKKNAYLFCMTSDSQMSPLNRLKRLFELGVEQFQNQKTDSNCFIQKMITEMADLSDPIRQTLKAGIDQWQHILFECLKEAQQLKEISDTHDISALSDFLYNGWEGAVMRTHFSGDIIHLKNYYNYVSNWVLK